MERRTEDDAAVCDCGHGISCHVDYHGCFGGTKACSCELNQVQVANTLAGRLWAVETAHAEHQHGLPFIGEDPCMILFGHKCAKSGCCSECGKKWPCPTVRAARGEDER